MSSRSGTAGRSVTSAAIRSIETRRSAGRAGRPPRATRAARERAHQAVGIAARQRRDREAARRSVAARYKPTAPPPTGNAVADWITGKAVVTTARAREGQGAIRLIRRASGRNGTARRAGCAASGRKVRRPPAAGRLRRRPRAARRSAGAGMSAQARWLSTRSGGDPAAAPSSSGARPSRCMPLSSWTAWR